MKVLLFQSVWLAYSQMGFLSLFMLMVRSYLPCYIVAANYDGNRFFTLQEGVKKVSYDGLGSTE